MISGLWLLIPIVAIVFLVTALLIQGEKLSITEKMLDIGSQHVEEIDNLRKLYKAKVSQPNNRDISYEEIIKALNIEGKSWSSSKNIQA